mmetsp:Transcript_84606/g.192842  ORF Transcript_84606/g.192842 Transcript_84606/m.192842 type:complete len:218 (+) Transcript_84606:52-705(+)
MRLAATVPAVLASFCQQSGWAQVWADEFDGAEVDTGAWTKDVRGPGDSRTRDATATADSVWVKDGSLVIRSNAHWTGSNWTSLTSGAVQTQGKVSWKGLTRVCVSAKLPGTAKAGRGIWPAHWMMPDDVSKWPCHGEIDIMEMINGDGVSHGTYHWSPSCDTISKAASAGQIHVGDDWDSAWHEYAVEYDGKTHVTFAVDGKVIHTITHADKNASFF